MDASSALTVTAPVQTQRLGEVQIEGDSLLLGKPSIISKANIHKFVFSAAELLTAILR